ncbi:MAG: type I DNA topoisomerase [Deltaproteobacteria bacterium]|nr:type I DNA topoisomerase [Deltaproteobacteria bacterium]
MAKSLLIVESPAKARTIKKYLGKEFNVLASVGHVKDLPKSSLGVDVENNFSPQYDVIKGKGNIIKNIKKEARSAEKVFLAPDPDREGEAIAWHIASEIKEKDKVSRVLFNEITKRGIEDAIKHPLPLNNDKFEAQQARRILDRLVGYQISPLLWDKVRRGLSAGRVQSVAVRVICEREKEIKAFVPREYWSVMALLEGSIPPPVEAKLLKIDNKKAELKSQEETDQLLSSIEGASYIIKKIDKKERRKNPSPPFITSTLQQDAARKLGFSAKKTMMLAQRLYEGLDFGDQGPVGLITYMRTDSTRIADEALAQVRNYISEKYGSDYLPKAPRQYKSSKSAQEAHEAIRPTSMKNVPELAKKHLERDQYRLYELIWNRFVASQTNPAIMDQTAIDIAAGKAIFRATGSVIKFAGFMAIYTEGKDQEDSSEKDKLLPPFSEGEALKLLKITPKQHFTEPPPRFSEATLVKELEDKGIGRPSTYAAIISNIQDREYVRLDSKRFYPTELGMLVTGLLVDNFPDIMNVEFTARMEGQLDEIEEGKADWLKAMKLFYENFRQALESAKVKMRDVKREEIPTDIVCDKCGTNMIIKWGKMGEFLACPNYPECKNTHNFTRDEAGNIQVVVEALEFTEENCPVCGNQMVIKRGRYGRFLACSTYPDCKGTKPITLGITCPDCGKGEVSEKRSRKGKVFYGCTEYPKCTFATWDKPLPENCPLCDAAFLVEKESKKEGNIIRCLNKDCGYKRAGKDQEKLY